MFNAKIIFTVLSLFIITANVFGQKSLKPEYAKKIEEADSRFLPQTPIIKRLTSDAEEAYLKGKVKSVFEEREGLGKEEKSIGMIPSESAYYDEQGYYLKRVYFEYRGRPTAVIIYGYLDGMRVTLWNSISYSDSVRLVAGDEEKKETKSKPDTRYDLKYDYKYKDGKLSEIRLIDNEGEKYMRYEYKHKPNQMEVLAYDEADKLNSKYHHLYDKNGTEIGLIAFNVWKPEIPETDKWKYENIVLDEEGNWIKRTSSKLEIKNGKEIYNPIAVEYRTITYYP